MRIEGWPPRLWLHYRWGRFRGWLDSLHRPPEERRAVRYEDEPWRDSRPDDLLGGAKR